jgi:SprT protein
MIDPRLVEQTNDYLKMAQEHFGRGFRLDTIRADIKGKTAGYFRMHRNGSCEINYNPVIFGQHTDDFLLRTVPHEVAHLVAYQNYGGKIRPHGKHWQTIMRLFGADVKRCHDYDVSATKSRQYRLFDYQCDCKQHSLTAIRHNRILKGQLYHCRNCHQPLIPVIS